MPNRTNKRREKSGSKRIRKLKSSFESSFLLFLAVRIVFFPFFLVKTYFLLMARHFLKWLLLNFVILFFILGYLATCYITLPDTSKLYDYKPTLTSQFYDRNGEMIYEIGNERRQYIDINKVPKQLIYAFISAEDKTFYTNNGIDINGIIRAGLVDIVRVIRRQKLEGASTITQQVVKNVLLTSEQKITRKIKELILSYLISKRIPKDKIMEIYLNHIYLGNQSYGIVVASNTYFGKNVGQLNLSEMAMLAAMPKAPSTINPFRNYNRAIQRRNWVLSRMFEDGYITESEYQTSKNTELIVKKKYNNYYPYYAPSFLSQNIISSVKDINKDELLNSGFKINLTIDGKTQKVAQEALNYSLERYSKNHGYKGAIMTFSEDELKTKTTTELFKSIDEIENIGKFKLAIVKKVEDDKVEIELPNDIKGIILLGDLSWAKQKITETEVSKKNIEKCSEVLNVGDVIVVDKKTDKGNYYTLEQIPDINGGVLVMNPKTGEILAMVGGYNDIAGGFNRTIQAFRQVGSTIKPFVYGAALENGFTPASIFMDAPLSINIGDGIVWNPENDSKRTSGPMTLRAGLERSKNTITIRIADAIGMTKIRKTIIKANINKKPENNLSTAIGSVESSLLQIAIAYSSFANDGILPKPYLISSIRRIADNDNQTENGNEEYEKNRLDSSDELNNHFGDIIENGDKGNNEKNNNLFNKIYFSNCDLNAKCQVEVEDINNKKEDNKTLFSPEVSYQIVNMLQGAVKRGTSVRLSSLGLPIAVKTGTSNGGKDLWCISVSPEIVVVAFVGYDIPMETNNYGSQYALPIVKDILSQLADKYEISDFKTPSGIKFVKINRKTGEATNQEDNKDVIFEAFKEEDEIPQIKTIQLDNGDDESEEHQDNEYANNVANEKSEDIDITDIKDDE